MAVACVHSRVVIARRSIGEKSYGVTPSGWAIVASGRSSDVPMLDSVVVADSDPAPSGSVAPTSVARMLWLRVCGPLPENTAPGASLPGKPFACKAGTVCAALSSRTSSAVNVRRRSVARGVRS